MDSTDSYTIAWRAWYYNTNSDVVEYTSVTTTLDDLPSDGFQSMRLWYSNNTGRYISGNDWYFFEEHPNGIIFGQSDDSYDSIVERYPNAIIKQGKHCPDGVMESINTAMIESTNPLL